MWKTKSGNKYKQGVEATGKVIHSLIHSFISYLLSTVLRPKDSGEGRVGFYSSTAVRTNRVRLLEMMKQGIVLLRSLNG